MIDLDRLKYQQVHSLKKTFDPYDRVQIAKKLNIPAVVLGDILQGYEQPCPEIEKRLLHLADEILIAEVLEPCIN